LAGVAAALVADTWLGIVEGDWLANTGFFDGAGAGERIALLVVWAVLGLAATVLTRSAHGTLMKPVSSSA
jgi:hypothetical protein